jgi:ankyrin repeat protein
VLVQASRWGRVALVGDLLAAGAPADDCDESDWTPIKVAALEGHQEVVRMLIEAGAGGVPADFSPDAFIQRTIAEYRFFELIAAGDVAEMRRLLGQWPTLARLDGALLTAAAEGQAEAAAILIEAGASLDLIARGAITRWKSRVTWNTPRS